MSWKTKIENLLTTGSITFLTIVFGVSAITKALYYIDRAPADVQQMTNVMFPSYIKTPLISAVFSSVKSFVLFISIFEFALSITFFYRPRIAALGVLAVMAGAEYVGWAVSKSPRPPSHPFCAGAGPTCGATQALHIFIALLAGLVYARSAPLCRQIKTCWQTVVQSAFGGSGSGRGARNTKNPYASKNRKNQ
jgi:hypothetical protein